MKAILTVLTIYASSGLSEQVVHCSKDFFPQLLMMILVVVIVNVCDVRNAAFRIYDSLLANFHSSMT